MTAGPTAGPTDSFSSPAVTWNALDEVHSQNPSVISAYGIQSGVGSFAVKWTTASASFVAIEASFFATGSLRFLGSALRGSVSKHLSSGNGRSIASCMKSRRLVRWCYSRRSSGGIAARPRSRVERPRRRRALRFKGAVFNLLTFFSSCRGAIASCRAGTYCTCRRRQFAAKDGVG